MTRKIALKGYGLSKAGKLVPRKLRQSVSSRIREKKSRRQNVVRKLG